METPSSSKPAANDSSHGLDTDAFAAKQHVKSQSVRARVCRTGSYFGIRPNKLANGKLDWPDVQVVAA